MSSTSPPRSPIPTEAPSGVASALGLRRDVIRTARRMNAIGINQGKSGNVSARHGEGFLITPSALSYDTMAPEDVVVVGMDGRAAGSRAPSTEWRFHRDVYAARPDVGAVVHTHSTHATTLACLGRSIPPFHYMVAAAGGSSIRCTPYATFGTQELADYVVTALEGRRACLLGNHGMVAVGATLDAALDLAVDVEALAAMYCRVLQIGEPRLLTDAEMAAALEKFRTYGTPAGPEPSAR